MTNPIVVKISGTPIEQAHDHAELWKSLATLADRAAGGLIIVHGGGKIVDQRLSELGLESAWKHGLRVTPIEHLSCVVGTLAGEVNLALTGALNNTSETPIAVGLTLADAGLTHTSIDSPDGIDLGRVGRITHTNPALLHTLVDAGYLPVVSSIGLGPDRCALNINADDAALGIALCVGAPLLVYLTDQPGVLDHNCEVSPLLSRTDVEERIAAGSITDGMIPKARACAHAAVALSAPVIVTSWKTPACIADPDALARSGTSFLPQSQRCTDAAPNTASGKETP